MKLGELKNQLINQIKELILSMLENIDMSNYDILIDLKDDSMSLEIKESMESGASFLSLVYKNGKIKSFRTKNIERIVLLDIDSEGGMYEMNVKDFIEFIRDERILIMTILSDNESELETKLKEILE